MQILSPSTACWLRVKFSSTEYYQINIPSFSVDTCAYIQVKKGNTMVVGNQNLTPVYLRFFYADGEV